SGLSLVGATAELSTIVVRDTLPMQGLDAFGNGIEATCNPITHVCGTLWLDSALIEANHATGIIVVGTDAEISSVVIRDTLPQQSDESGGIGLYSCCDPAADVCSSLRLDHAFLQANQSMGIALLGTHADISSVVIRDTLPQQSDGMFGNGIQAFFDEDTGAIGTLRLERALLQANHESGISLWGIDAVISSVIIRDTLPRQKDDRVGLGLQVDCDPDTGACGTLRLHHGLLRSNKEGGIGIRGANADISSVVIRDTLPYLSVDTEGSGLQASCDPFLGVCGSLRLDHALVRANHALGIDLMGTDAELSSVVLLDTLPRQNDDMLGTGLQVTCDLTTGVCGSLRLEHSYFQFNHYLGILLGGTEAEVSSIVIRDTLPQVSDGMLGAGFQAGCDADEGVCSTLRLEHAVLEANHAGGLALTGSDVEISSVFIRDTQPEQSSGAYGKGLQATCDADQAACGSLRATDSLILRSEMTGVGIFGVPTTLSGVTVMDTRHNEDGYFAGKHAIGVFAMCDEFTGNCSTLDMTGCMVGSSFSAGVAVQAVSGSIQSSMIRDVYPQALDDAYGYGIQVEGAPGAAPTVFHVRDTTILDAELAGILYYLAGGTVSRSQVTGGQYSIVMNQGANPVIEDDNDLSGTIESEPSWSNMDPAPAPEPLLPVEM
ncbi:hypothetical protein ACFL51_02305, partial [Myxococcota bacterium]